MTHTLEVSQIGRSICGFLNQHSRDLNESFFIDADLVEAVCLAHDIGHAPFGHAGERELNQLMGKYGGFEGNAQTLRLLTETIWHGTAPGERVGLCPTRALLDGVLKYKKTHSSVKTINHFIYDEQRKYVEFVLSEKDPSGFKYRLPFEDQVEMYKFVLENLDRKRITPALCKEDVSVWKAVGLKFDGCHCLLGGTTVPSEIVSTKSYTDVLNVRARRRP